MYQKFFLFLVHQYNFRIPYKLTPHPINVIEQNYRTSTNLLILLTSHFIMLQRDNKIYYIWFTFKLLIIKVKNKTSILINSMDKAKHQNEMTYVKFNFNCTMKNPNKDHFNDTFSSVLLCIYYLVITIAEPTLFFVHQWP